MKALKLFLVLALTAFFIGACNQTEPAENANAGNDNKIANATPEATASPDEVASGKKLYSEYCAKCHQEDGTGGKVEIEGKTINPENLTTENMKKHPDEEYIEYMTKGIPDEGMPSFKDVLSEAEMKQIVAYIRKELQK